MIRTVVRQSARLLFCMAFFVGAAMAQPTYFNYQGTFSDNGQPANGSYDFEFELFDTLENGNSLGPAIAKNSVQVTDGQFSVTLDFGAVFPGEERFLEIRVQAAAPLAEGGSSLTSHTVLSPRQRIAAVPYAIKSKSSESSTTADQLAGVAASQYVLTTDPRMTDARTPTAGSGDYVQNTTTQQTSSNFNISGKGTANILNSETHFEIGGTRVFEVTSSSNVFAGPDAGAVNNTGTQNTFIGAGAGRDNLTGNSNTFVGRSAGIKNLSGSNTFVGALSGRDNTLGASNSFFGLWSGQQNVDGSGNSYFGAGSGTSSNASGNSFFGRESGGQTSSGGENSFFGYRAGYGNETGTSNSFFGYRAGLGIIRPGGSGSDNSFFGHSSGQSITTGFLNAFFGKESGFANTTGAANTFIGRRAGFATTTGVENTFVGAVSGNANVDGSDNSAFGRGADFGSGSLTHATAIGSETIVTSSNTVQLGRDGLDVVRVGKLGTNGSTSLCLNASDEISTCNNPLAEGSTSASAEALVKEQAAEIQALKLQLSALKALVCEDRPKAEICRQ